MVASTEHGKQLVNHSERISALESEAETERRYLATKADIEELRGAIKSLKWQLALGNVDISVKPYESSGKVQESHEVSS